MTEETLLALKASIIHWHENYEKAVAEHKIHRSYTSCPLCAQFHWLRQEGMKREKSCRDCPIFERTGKQFCEGTPYCRIFDFDFPERVEEEILFLVSLLPEGETVEVDGWIYGNF